MKMKLLFQNSFIILVLALIITISTINSSIFSQEENTQGQGQEQKKYNHYNLKYKT
jgi:hypothetical protein